MTVVVIDTGLGNLRSVEKALAVANAGATIARSDQPDVVRSADRIVFPGQGAFRDCMRTLESGLGEAIVEKIRAGTPYLGICLGLQVLFESSAEAPDVAGLGLYAGAVERLTNDGGVKIPHMGWNELELTGGGHALLDAAGGADTWVYFVHSYHAVPDDESLVVARVMHGKNIVTAAIARENVFATQFHPEKSQKAGLALLAAFLR